MCYIHRVIALSRIPWTSENSQECAPPPISYATVPVYLQSMNSADFGEYKMVITLETMIYHPSYVPDEKIHKKNREKKMGQELRTRESWYKDEDHNFWGQIRIFGFDSIILFF